MNYASSAQVTTRAIVPYRSTTDWQPRCGRAWISSGGRGTFAACAVPGL